jgi:ribonuclease HI
MILREKLRFTPILKISWVCTGRRERLEKSDFYSKQNRRITNWELYKAFYRLTDELNIEIKKVIGHKRTSTKDNIDRLFTIVDRASRNAVRGEK